MTAPNLRDRYLQDSVNTASPGKLLVMLYERLVVDLLQGEEALRAGERERANERITHAQEIILELRATLDRGGMGRRGRSGRLYGFLLTELIQANISATRTRSRLPRAGGTAARRLAEAAAT
jgi:flagellar protein FliS